jgi:hypothetical protein
MRITLLTGSDELNLSLERYLRFLLDIEGIFIAKLGHPETLEPEMMNSDLWIAEVFNPEVPRNPEGFRTAKKLAGKMPFLLLFIGDAPSDFPREGDFWLVMPSSISLVSKIEEISNSPPPTDKDYRSLEEMWPLLGRGPYHRHHYTHGEGKSIE